MVIYSDCLYYLCRLRGLPLERHVARNDEVTIPDPDYSELIIYLLIYLFNYLFMYLY